MLLIACPGQGSQKPGFLTEWVAEPRYRSYLETLSEAAELDIITHGTTSDAETIRDTAVAQPLIVAASLLSLTALRERVTLPAFAATGHSVGEFAAAVAAGVLSDVDAMRLVGVRARAMAAAAAQAETGMAAVVGGDEDEVISAIAAAGLVAANRNGPGQIVAAGELAKLTELSEQAPKGARVVTLAVAGAFHTEFMASAVEVLRAAAATVEVHDPSVPLYSNADGEQVTSGAAALESLVAQVSRPVRWDLCLQSFARDGVSTMVELLPGGTLAGIAKRALREATSIAITTPADLNVVTEHLSAT